MCFGIIVARFFFSFTSAPSMRIVSLFASSFVFLSFFASSFLSSSLSQRRIKCTPMVFYCKKIHLKLLQIFEALVQIHCMLKD